MKAETPDSNLERKGLTGLLEKSYKAMVEELRIEATSGVTTNQEFILSTLRDFARRHGSINEQEVERVMRILQQKLNSLYMETGSKTVDIMEEWSKEVSKK